jgi:YwiC-like protein
VATSAHGILPGVQQTRRSTASARPTPIPRRPPLAPKEHGASFMSVHALLLGLVAAVTAGRVDVVGALLAAAITALFVPLTATISVMSHATMRDAARRRALVLAGAGTALGIAAFVHGPTSSLVWLVVAAGPVAGWYALARRRAGARAVVTQLAAIAGISLLAPATWLLCIGARGPWWLSAPAAFLSFGGTVPYVRERVRRRRTEMQPLGPRLSSAWRALAWQAAAIVGGVLAALLGGAGALLPIAFVPGAVKTATGIARRERKPPIRHIGYVETAVSTVFAVLAGIGLGVAA